MNLFVRLFLSLSFLVSCCVPLHSSAVDVSSEIWLNEYSVLPDGTIRDDEGWLLTDGSFTNVFRDDSGLLNRLGVTADSIAPFAGRPVFDESAWNTYAVSGLLPDSWVRSAQSYSFLDSTVVIVSIKGKTGSGSAITILNQPVSQTVLEGNSAAFSCLAESSQTLSYQWRFKGKNIPGATGSELDIPSVSKANKGIYQVALSAGGKPVMTHRAYLKIALPVTLRTQPKSRTVKAGKGVAFRVSAKGTGPFTYTWYHDGAPLPGTKSFLSIPHVDATSAGTYAVTVSSAWSSATSTNAVLTIAP